MYVDRIVWHDSCSSNSKNQRIMIIIHIDSQKDTAFLKKCYEGLEHTIVLYNPTRSKVNETLQKYPQEDVMMLGHGSGNGLFSHDWRGYIIDSTNVNLLKGRNCIGIWCWAKDFGRKHGLRGYFTSMFISNGTEARSLKFNADEQDVFNEVALFSERVHDLIENETPYSEWVQSLNRVADISKGFVKYNYEAMEYFDGTQKPKEEDGVLNLWAQDVGTDTETDYHDNSDEKDAEDFFEDYCMENGIEGDWAREIAYPIFLAGWNSHKFFQEL